MKIIKLYGWELAFQRFIQAIREEEVRTYIKMKMARSVDRAIADFSPYTAAFLCFLILYCFGGEDDLSAAKIIGALPFIILLNGFNDRFSLALSAYFQISIVMDRFVSIMNLQDIRLRTLEGGSALRTPSVSQG